MSTKPRSGQSGFTLLEVLIALAIVGMALGTVFALSAGSKRLAMAAAADTRSILVMRSAIHAAQVRREPDFLEYPDLVADLRFVAGAELEPPKRQTQKLLYVLERYEIQWEDPSQTSEPVVGVRWKRRDAIR